MTERLSRLIAIAWFAGAALHWSATATAEVSADDPDTWSVRIAWTAPGDDVSHGTAAEYEIRYHESKGAMQSWVLAHRVEGEPLPMPSGTTQTYVLTGLQRGQSYWVAIKARDEAYNWSPVSKLLKVDEQALAGSGQALEQIN